VDDVVIAVAVDDGACHGAWVCLGRSRVWVNGRTGGSEEGRGGDQEAK
jgi:hypothetical protein